ncbi:hypothetical protein [Desertimonas flava]|uniref:hypothetical protein n=1 Tax=Desertimonas flava TaxID=2064846 RepID=UPI000E34B567|nr:hypothetical protein [Desertimonas flava]
MKDGAGAAVGLALVAGEIVWADIDEPASGVERLTAVVELAALACLASMLWLMSSARFPAPVGAAAVAPIAGTLAAAALATRPARLLAGIRREARVWPSIVWRSVAAFVLIAALVANAPRWGGVALWPVSIVLGCEAALCAWRIGLDVRPVRWYRSFFVSALHFGALGAVLASIVRSSDEAGDALEYYGLFHLLAVLVCLTAGLLDMVRSVQHEADVRDANRIIAEEHRRRAHWLHDDVSSQLRIVSLKVQHNAATAQDVVALIDDLDHTLRLRQLDELLASGTARLAEIIQPYVRNAQGSGVTISAVPTFEDASLVVGSATGRTFARAASIFTSNAIQAGATDIGFHISHDDGEIELGVVDNAGGFDLGDVPAGRALWELAQTVGPRRLAVDRCDGLTVVKIRIPLEESETDGVVADR